MDVLEFKNALETTTNKNDNPILENIKKEIDSILSVLVKYYDNEDSIAIKYTIQGALLEINQIINKYKTKSENQEPRWIPVSEKLPNHRDWYLGIFKEPDTGWINPLPFICDYVGSETKATTKEFWILRGFTDRDYKECDYYYNLECVAWMPLPKPYEPQESEDKE